MAIPSLLKYSNGDCAGFTPASDLRFSYKATTIYSVLFIIIIPKGKENVNEFTVFNKSSFRIRKNSLISAF